MAKIESYQSQPQTRVDLHSIDVDAVFELLQNSTSFFRISSRTTDDIVTQCPFHGSGNEQHPSFGICNNRYRNEYGLFHCFACGAKGNILQLVNHVYNKQDNSEYAVSFIQSVSDVAYTDFRGRVELKPRTPLKKPEVTEVELLSYQDQKNEYLANRHIKPLIQRVFNCGYDPVDESVTFPVRTVDGAVYFIVRRKINFKWYSYPPGVDKPVYGMYEFNSIFPKAHTVVLVESVINALTLWGYQIPAVALLGTGSQTQIDFLNTSPIRRYILCLDGDAAGAKGTEKLKSKLHANTLSVPMPPGYDVNDLDEETMRILYALKG